MKTIIINENDSGQRVDKFLGKFLPDMPKSLLYKALRKKRVKLGKKALAAQDILHTGDEQHGQHRADGGKNGERTGLSIIQPV